MDFNLTGLWFDEVYLTLKWFTKTGFEVTTEKLSVRTLR